MISFYISFMWFYDFGSGSGWDYLNQKIKNLAQVQPNQYIAPVAEPWYTGSLSCSY